MSIPQHAVTASFLDYLKFEKRYSVHTLISYEGDLRDFFDFMEITYGPTPVEAITYPMIRSWLAGLKEGGLSSKSINRKISSLKSFFKYHLKRGAITSSPTANIISPKVKKRLPVFVKESETEVLMKTVSTVSEDWKSLNGKLIILLFYSTGMRLSELIGLKENQVDAARGHIKVLGKGSKERIIPVSADLLRDLAAYQQLKRKEFENATEYLLVTEKGKKLYPKYAYLLVRAHLETAGTLDKKSPHVLRHTFATHLMNNGADLNAVKELLGHSSLAATQVYTHNTIDKLKDIHRKAHPKA
ncbi:MAG: integrase [Chitinophagaceae bacterium]|nr:MAG: integrase [Chitinophagaceae bacterium]